MSKELKTFEDIEIKESEKFHWADDVAEKVIKEFKKKLYVCAAGITPSGTVHIGNFREVITVELVARALKDNGKKAKFIYSWDDYDRFRKIPKNMPKQELLKNFIGMPTIETPDTFSCHKNYAEHLEKEFQECLPEVGIFPEFIYQHKKYQNCEYAEEIKFLMNKKQEIKKILDKYRAAELDEWWPCQVYCEKCKKDTTKITDYDGDYTIEYRCDCGYKGKTNFSKKGNVKLVWRVDWPMRWHYEKVDFEPGGKEHSTPGGSRTTAKEIIEKIYNEKAPLYLMYDFIIVKGAGGKMSSSLGNVITLKDCLQIYEPQIIRYMFVSRRPNTEFSISFDADVLKIYADYDSLEEKYFKDELNEKEKRIYELSQTEQKKEYKRIFSPQLRQLAELAQLKTDKEILEYYKKEIKTKQDSERVKKRVMLARNWLKQAPSGFLFSIQKTINKEIIKKLDKKYIKAVQEAINIIDKKDSEKEISNKLKNTIEKNALNGREFFKTAYLIILGKENGPRLSNLLLIEHEKIKKLIESFKNI